MTKAGGARDLIAPILPSRDLGATAAFWGGLGFETALLHPSGYLILRRAGAELHFWLNPGLDPAENDAGAYMRPADLEALAAACARLDLPEEGIPRHIPPEPKPWGMRELVLIDPDGNLLRAGLPLD